MPFTHRTAATAAVVLSALFAVSACGGADARRESHMERGQTLFTKGNFEKAQVEFRNALQISPNDTQARLMNARVAEKLGELRGAAKMYQSVIDIDPENVAARASLGRLYVFAGAPGKALEMVDPVIAKHPENADLLTVRGAARIQQGDAPGALVDAEAAVKIAPTNEGAIALLASLYRQRGEVGKAVGLIEKALRQNPASVDLHQVLASLYVNVEKPELAEAHLRKVIDLRPKELSHRYQLAVFYVRSKRLDDAERVLKDAVAAQPEKDEAKLAYVEFLTAQRSAVQGEQALAQFIKQNPDDYDLQLGLGALQQQRGDPAKALATYQNVIATADDALQGVSARNRVAALLMSQKKYDEAGKLIAEVLEKNPRDNDALVMRGNLAMERKDPAAAIADLRAVLRDQPASVPVMRTLARAHLANGEPALAEENLRAAVEVAPTDVAARIELAQLLSQTHRAESAVTLLEEAVLKAPTDVAARESLVRAYLAKQDLDAARRAAEDLKILAPHAAVGYFLAGVVAQNQNRFDDAQKDLERALQLQPNAMDALAALTRQDLARGRAEQALARVRATVDAAPGNGAARNLLGEIYIANREFPKAIEQLDEAVRLMPKWWMAYRNLALAKLGGGDAKGGLQVYEKAVAITNHEPALVTDLAALYERQQRFDDAIRLYESLHKTNPQLDLAANNLAMLLVTYKQDRASLDRAQDLTAAFADSDSAALLDTHGWVRLRSGSITEALTSLEKAADRAPQSKIIRYHLAMAQLKAGQRDRARTNLEEALAGTPNFAGSDEARTTLAELNRRAG